MSIQPISRLEALHPVMRPYVNILLKRLKQQGIDFKPYETYRGPARQQQGVDGGKSKVGPWGSYHNYGLAIDMVGATGAPWGNDKPWQAYGVEVRNAGLDWGGDWANFKDLVHAQYAYMKMGDLKLGGVASASMRNIKGWADWMLWWWPQVTDESVSAAVAQRLLGLKPDGFWGEGSRLRAAKLIKSKKISATPEHDDPELRVALIEFHRAKPLFYSAVKRFGVVALVAAPSIGILLAARKGGSK